MKRILLPFLLASSVYTDTGELSNIQKRELAREVSVLVRMDKQQSQYAMALKDVVEYPKLSCEVSSDECEKGFASYTKSLLPYLLVKEQTGELSSQSAVFNKLIKASAKIKKYVELTAAEESIHRFLGQKLALESQLQFCSNLRTRYQGQKPMMDVQVKRVSFKDEKDLESQLNDVRLRLNYLTSDSHK